VAAINVTAVNAHIDEQAMHGELKDAVWRPAGENLALARPPE
jgi:hypothetical protein